MTSDQFQDAKKAFDKFVSAGEMIVEGMQASIKAWYGLKALEGLDDDFKEKCPTLSDMVNDHDVDWDEVNEVNQVYTDLRKEFNSFFLGNKWIANTA